MRIGIFVGGLLFGSLMGLSRIVQGGHYLSDVIWSLAIVYFTAWVVHALLLSAELNGISDVGKDEAETSKNKGESTEAQLIQDTTKAA